VSKAYARDLPQVWKPLYDRAAKTGGIFHADEARVFGVSRAILHNVACINSVRGYHNVFYFHAIDFSPIAWNDAAAYVWARGAGVLSHGSALSLWDLSDYLPSKTTLTLPTTWRARKIPDQIFPVFTDIRPHTLKLGGFEVSSPEQAIYEFRADHWRADLSTQALRQLEERGPLPDRPAFPADYIWSEWASVPCTTSPYAPSPEYSAIMQDLRDFSTTPHGAEPAVSRAEFRQKLLDLARRTL